MVLQGFVRKIRPLEILTPEQIEEVHIGTMDVLWNTGVRIEHEKALKLLEGNGCEVDHDRRRARIPEYLVRDCLRKCPSSVTIRARDPKRSLIVGGNRTYMKSYEGLNTVDLETWEKRTPTLRDQDEAVRVLDYLDNLHMVSYGPYHSFSDVHPLMYLPMADASRVRNTTKAIFVGCLKKSEIWAIKMAKVTDQTFLGAFSGSDPLTFYGDEIEAALSFAEAGFPVLVNSGSVAGATGPATFAGLMVSSNALMLAGMVLLQLFRPGTGIVFCPFIFQLGMTTGELHFGNVERGMFQAMFQQFARHYGVPTWHTALTSSKKIDYQSGYEKTLQLLLCALAGGNIIGFYGAIYDELSVHPVMSVLDDDIAGMVGRVLKGVDVTDETLAVDLIKQVGPIPGQFVATKHTRDWWKKEWFIPKIADRLSYDTWIEKGKKDALEHAKEKVKEILASHEPTPLPADQDKEIDQILEEAKNWYKQKGWW